MSYFKLLERFRDVMAYRYGLRWLNQQPNNDTLVGVFSKNRAEVKLYPTNHFLRLELCR